jgi:phospholipid N-methyltransferase
MQVAQIKTNNFPQLFSAPAEQNKLVELFAEYDERQANLKKISDFGSGKEDMMHYFFEGSGIQSYYAKRIFDYEPALKILNSEYWQKVIDMTDILQTMPAKKRTEWSDMIREHKTPDFTRESVIATITSMAAQRQDFFAQKVEGIFRNLSGEHVTNQPAAFSKRMILSNVIDSYGYPNWNKCEYLDDFREVIRKIRKSEYAPKMLTKENVSHIIKGNDGDNYGKWFEFDGGAFKMRVYKVGTAHIEVHPEIAVELNLILAKNNPCVIPHAKRKPKKFGKMKDAPELRTDLIDPNVLNLIASGYEHLQRYGYLQFSSYYADKATEQQLEQYKKVLTYIGGCEDKHGHFHFEFDAKTVIADLLRIGCLPEQKSHQFYPTKPELAERVAEQIVFDDGATVLEPSAGQGALADALPKHLKIECVEINPLHCSVLKSKGYKVKQDNFLGYFPKKEYDYIVMNPPFSNDQAEIHVQKAFSLLKQDGVILAILPATLRNTIIIEGQKHEYSEVINDAFDNTNISVVILTLTKTSYRETRFG